MRRLLPAVALLLALSACGNHDGGYPSQAFTDKATGTCVSASKAPQKRFPYPDFNPMKPDVAKLPAIGAFYTANGWPVAHMLQTQLHALGEPDSGRKVWDRFLAQFDRYIATYRQQIETARKSDAKGFTATAVEFRDMVNGANAAADKAHVPRCSPFHLGSG